MSDAVEVAIETGLLARAVDFATVQGLTISLPNIDFTPPVVSKTAKWLRASFIPADTAALGVNSESSNQHYGLLQIDVFYGLGGGEIAAGRIASDIIAYFARGTTISRDGFVIQMTRPPYRGPSLKDEPWVMIPVRIPYLCFAADTGGALELEDDSGELLLEG